MKYNKPPLTYEQQAQKLIDRGLPSNDKDLLITRLKMVNYYRLAGYFHTFRLPDDKFKNGTTFEKVWRRYTFDRRLRLLVLDAIERVEIACRTQLVYEHVHEYISFGYRKRTSLPHLNQKMFNEFITKVTEETKRHKKRKQELFIIHYFDKYDEEEDLPLWILSEIIPYGAMFTFYNGVEASIKQKIALTYGIPDKVLTSWLHTLNGIRNICAHHGRLWNRELGVKPLFPKVNKYPEWHSPIKITNDRVFVVLTRSSSTPPAFHPILH